ncbi:MAG: hypothetical protein A2W35_09010 [Chloroflexi bacterium RBG_16_57_11]|nr:MAG: hypothetical protein A2W35_09010 [Chloroflexi bacterium RBG_16_57_11]
MLNSQLQSSTWLNRRRYNPLPSLLAAPNPAIAYFARRDLLGEVVPPVETLWELPGARQLLRRQMESGAWPYPGSGIAEHRASEDYNQIETYRNLSILVEKFGFDRRHPAMQAAAEYLFTKQTAEGDLRGIYGNQYTPNYTAAIMELLIKSGYAQDTRIGRAFEWLLSIRQDDGGWTIPLRTHKFKYTPENVIGETLQPVRGKPFSHLATGVVLRAFAAHPEQRHNPAAHRAGELLAGRFFRRDTYPDRGAISFWTGFSFPFWFTDLLSSLDALTQIGFTADHPDIRRGLDWFIEHQDADGSWRLKILRGKERDVPQWLGLAICRVFARLETV